MTRRKSPQNIPEKESISSVMPHHMARYLGVTALAAIVIVSAGIGQTNLGRAILRQAGMAGGPASYTSLAFSRPQDLQGSPPAHVVAVSFLIRNAGGVPRDYQWSVTLAESRRARNVATGSVRILPGRGATIRRSAKISCTSGQAQIVVSLAAPAESIDAWMACPSSRS